MLAAGLLLPVAGWAAGSGGEKGPSEAVFVAQVVTLLVVGRLLGEAMHRLRQPAVIGQLLAGILLGPSIFGAILPEPQHWLFPADPAQKAMIDGVGALGILLLLLLTGMETDLALVRRTGRAAFSVSVTGIAVPFACGVLVGQYVLPDTMLPAPDHRTVTALFLGTALSISSIKIVAIVVREMNFMRRDLGQVIVASAIIDDTIGWILIAITFGLARPEGLDARSLAVSILGTVAFLVVSYTAGRRIVSLLIRWANDDLRSEFAVVTTILVVMGAMALVTDAIGVHTVLGAFVAGVLVGESPLLTGHIEAQLRGLITALFMPVFFALAGLGTDITILKDPQLLAATGGLILIASLGKFGGAFLGGALGGLSRAECLALALGMNARGSTEVIVATIGLSIGALDRHLFTMIVTMAVFTTMLMPPTLRWALARLPVGEKEAARLTREALEADSFVAGLERILLAADESPAGRFAARLTGLISGPRGLPTTVMHLAEDARLATGEDAARRVTDNAEAARQAAVGDVTGTVDVIVRQTREPVAAAAVAIEAAKGYDLTVVGREPATAPEGGFAPEIAAILEELEAARAVVVARGVLRRQPMDGPLRILVPVTGSRASRQAADFAFAIARLRRDASVTVLYVSAPEDRRDQPGTRRLGSAEASRKLERGIFAEVADAAAMQGVPIRTRVRLAGSPADAILRQLRRSIHTLVVLGVSRRPSDVVPFGKTAAAVLAGAEQTIVFVAAEEEGARGGAVPSLVDEAIAPSL